MSAAERSRRRRARRRARLRVALVALALGALAAGLAVGSGSVGAPSEPEPSGVVELLQGERVVGRAAAPSVAGWSAARLERWIERRVRPRRVERRGRARVMLRAATVALPQRVRALARRGGGRYEVRERFVSSTIRLPVVKQALRNNCETAALSMMLASRGVRVRQLELQRQLPRSGPRDPAPAVDGGVPTWGDPQRGFVGRAEGGGTNGGFGVFERPIALLARRHGVRLEDLSRRPAREIYRRLMRGRPVMVWIGLSEGPYMTWRTPSGERFTGNFGEHTVVLTGIDGDRLEVNDPLPGQRAVWTRAEFTEMWQRLGRRALAA